MLEIHGVLLGLVGVFCMAFLDTVVDKWQKKKEIKRLKALEDAEDAEEAAKKADK